MDARFCGTAVGPRCMTHLTWDMRGRSGGEGESCRKGVSRYVGQMVIYSKSRSYITFDILRRVFVDYFNYEVFYVMNVTDIDDKIIRRARREHLFAQYIEGGKALANMVSDITEAMGVSHLTVHLKVMSQVQ